MRKSPLRTLIPAVLLAGGVALMAVLLMPVADGNHPAPPASLHKQKYLAQVSAISTALPSLDGEAFRNSTHQLGNMLNPPRLTPLRQQGRLSPADIPAAERLRLIAALEAHLTPGNVDESLHIADLISLLGDDANAETSNAAYAALWRLDARFGKTYREFRQATQRVASNHPHLLADFLARHPKDQTTEVHSLMLLEAATTPELVQALTATVQDCMARERHCNRYFGPRYLLAAYLQGKMDAATLQDGLQRVEKAHHRAGLQRIATLHAAQDADRLAEYLNRRLQDGRDDADFLLNGNSAEYIAIPLLLRHTPLRADALQPAFEAMARREVRPVEEILSNQQAAHPERSEELLPLVTVLARKDNASHSTATLQALSLALAQTTPDMAAPLARALEQALDNPATYRQRDIAITLIALDAASGKGVVRQATLAAAQNVAQQHEAMLRRIRAASTADSLLALLEETGDAELRLMLLKRPPLDTGQFRPDETQAGRIYALYAQIPWDGDVRSGAVKRALLRHLSGPQVPRGLIYSLALPALLEVLDGKASEDTRAELHSRQIPWLLQSHPAEAPHFARIFAERIARHPDDPDYAYLTPNLLKTLEGMQVAETHLAPLRQLAQGSGNNARNALDLARHVLTDARMRAQLESRRRELANPATPEEQDYRNLYDRIQQVVAYHDRNDWNNVMATLAHMLDYRAQKTGGLHSSAVTALLARIHPRAPQVAQTLGMATAKALADNHYAAYMKLHVLSPYVPEILAPLFDRYPELPERFGNDRPYHLIDMHSYPQQLPVVVDGMYDVLRRLGENPDALFDGTGGTLGSRAFQRLHFAIHTLNARLYEQGIRRDADGELRILREAPAWFMRPRKSLKAYMLAAMRHNCAGESMLFLTQRDKKEEYRAKDIAHLEKLSLHRNPELASFAATALENYCKTEH